jgi:LL-diaminopimelate aminotransferase
MARVNDHYLKLRSSYLFTEAAARVKAFQAAHPDAKVIRLGIGDVTRPLPDAVVSAMHAAVDEMTRIETFRGYGPEPGYEFLTELVCAHDYGARGVKVAPDEVFVSDGTKSDSGNIQEIFAADATIALTDPVYPVYVDSNVMAGRTGAPDAAAAMPGSCTWPARSSATSPRPSPIAPWTSCTCAIRTIPPAPS